MVPNGAIGREERDPDFGPGMAKGSSEAEGPPQGRAQGKAQAGPPARARAYQASRYRADWARRAFDGGEGNGTDRGIHRPGNGAGEVPASAGNRTAIGLRGRAFAAAAADGARVDEVAIRGPGLEATARTGHHPTVKHRMGTSA